MTLIEQIRALITVIPEPCALAFGASTTIGGMGLIEDVTVVDGNATVTLCLTDAACVHFPGLCRYITDALADLPGINRVEVCQTLDTLWTPDRMAAT